MWIKLKRDEENLSLFSVEPGPDNQGASFSLEIKDGKVHWSHNDENENNIFDLLIVQRSSMPSGLWTHIGASYDSHNGLAKLYIDTQLIKTETGAGRMSSKFVGKVAVGKGGALPGLVDEFYLFSKALVPSDIRDISELCNLDANYPIPMETSTLTGSEMMNLDNRLAHRHSNIEIKNGDHTYAQNQCNRQAVFFNTDLSGGKTAGVFVYDGDTSSIEECIQKCCDSSKCHLAYLEKNRCYNIICHFPALCQPIKAGKALITLGYIVRDGNSVYEPDEIPTLKPKPSIQPFTHVTIQPVIHQKCLQSMVYYGVALRGGWTSGKFTDMGIVPSLQKCVQLCCNDSTCDLAMLMSQKCFTIHCYSPEDCQTVPNGHAQIAYVTREGYAPIVPTKPTTLLIGHRHQHKTTSSPSYRPGVTFSPTISRKRSDMSLHLTFDHMDEDEVLDESGYNNNGQMSNGTNISPGGGIRGNGVMFQGGVLLLDGGQFSPKPLNAITICLWIKLRDVKGKRTLFEALSSLSQPGVLAGIFLEVKDGRVRWFSNNENGVQIFSVESGDAIQKDTWFFIAVTYDSESGEAKIFVDGGLQSISVGRGILIQDWSSKAGFGAHQEGRSLHGFMDDIYIFTSALYRDEIVSYIKNFKEKHDIKPPAPLLTESTTTTTTTTTVLTTTKTTATTPLEIKTTRRPKTTVSHKPPKVFRPTKPLFKPTTHKTTPHIVKTTHHTATGAPSLRAKSKTTPKRLQSSSKKSTTTTPTTKTATVATTKTTTPTKSSTAPLYAPKPTDGAAPVCKNGNIYRFTDLKGGLVAGNFLDRGLTSGILPCMELCCSHRNCDLAYMISGRCYLVECYTEDLCSIVPKGVGIVSPTIGLVVRPNGPKIPELSDALDTLPKNQPTLKEPSSNSFMNDVNELELELGTASNGKLHKCVFQNTLAHTTFVGGLRAGNFSNKGRVISMKTCQDLCCNDLKCDVAVMMKQSCFLVACNSMELCQPRAAKLERFSLLLSYRDRSAEKEDVDSSAISVKPVFITETARITTTTTTVKPTTILGKQELSNETIDMPEALKPDDEVKSWCAKSFILPGMRLNDVSKAGVYQNFGIVSDIKVCIKYCCDLSDCTVAYLDENMHCYVVRCFNPNLCKAVIGAASNKIGYVIRNGWSLFKNEKEAIEDKVLTDDDTKNISTSKGDINVTTPFTNNTMHKTESKVIEPANKIGYCREKEILKDRRFIMGMKAGIFTEHGEVVNFPSCLVYCCSDKTCDIAYMVDKTCYSVKCFTNSSCDTFAVPNFFLNPIMAIVSRSPSNEGLMISAAINISETNVGHHYTVSAFPGSIKMDKLKLKITKKRKPNHNYKPKAIQNHRNVKFLNRGHKKAKHVQLVHKNNKEVKPDDKNIISKLVHEMLGESSSASGEISSVESGDGSGTHKPIIYHEARTHRKKNLHQHHHKNHKHKNNKLKKLHGKMHQKLREKISFSNLPSLAYLNLTEDVNPDKKHYFPMEKVDIQMIQALSPDKDFTRCDANKYGCEHFCISLIHGGSRCMCNIGYKLALDGKHCLYEGDCDARAHGCQQACKFNEDGFQCFCRSGFLMKKTQENECQDMDECTMGIHGCSDICINTIGSYLCQCHDDLTLSDDGMTCGKHNDLKKSNIAHVNDTFTIPAMIVSAQKKSTYVTQGHSVVLECKSSGYPTPTIVWAYRDNKTYVIKDDDRHRNVGGGALVIQDASMNDTGAYLCITSNIAGTDSVTYNLNVTDLNECELPVHKCEHVCQNTLGSYYCSCYNGYLLSDDQTSCIDRNECFEVNDCEQVCQNAVGSYQCECFQGFHLAADRKSCQDLNECLSNHTNACSQICNNTVGGYSCSCFPGFHLSRDNKTCEKTIPMPHRHTQLFLSQVLNGSYAYILLTSFTLLCLAMLCGTIIYLVHRYRKQNKLREENCGNEIPPINTRSSAIFSWNN